MTIKRLSTAKHLINARYIGMDRKCTYIAVRYVLIPSMPSCIKQSLILSLSRSLHLTKRMLWSNPNTMLNRSTSKIFPRFTLTLSRMTSITESTHWHVTYSHNHPNSLRPNDSRPFPRLQVQISKTKTPLIPYFIYLFFSLFERLISSANLITFDQSRLVTDTRLTYTYWTSATLCNSLINSWDTKSSSKSRLLP